MQLWDIILYALFFFIFYVDICAYTGINVMAGKRNFQVLRNCVWFPIMVFFLALKIARIFTKDLTFSLKK